MALAGFFAAAPAAVVLHRARDRVAAERRARQLTRARPAVDAAGPQRRRRRRRRRVQERRHRWCVAVQTPAAWVVAGAVWRLRRLPPRGVARVTWVRTQRARVTRPVTRRRVRASVCRQSRRPGTLPRDPSAVCSRGRPHQAPVPRSTVSAGVVRGWPIARLCRIEARCPCRRLISPIIRAELVLADPRALSAITREHCSHRQG
ncbi:uncharacterized protein V1510DRAFT_412417 [Dipodascopsis tothii]|uniref:uncharacterized protein n=1 Tax=Dipodascopsis tothii TaxID=44089 RepID=UPI0034CDECB4